MPYLDSEIKLSNYNKTYFGIMFAYFSVTRSVTKLNTAESQRKATLWINKANIL